LNLVDGVVAEMIVLAGHRPEIAHLPEQPLDRLVAAAQIARDELSGLVGEIEEDRARLEQGDWLAAVSRRVIDDGRYAVVRRDRQERRFELLALADVDRNELVRQSGFLKENC
jgi:hypothetical protein